MTNVRKLTASEYSPRNQQPDKCDIEKAACDPSVAHGYCRRNSVTFISQTEPAQKRSLGAAAWSRLLFTPALIVLFLSHLHPQNSDHYDTGAPFAPQKIQKLWASYAPYYSVKAYKSLPPSCHLTQVNIVGQRIISQRKY